jgi:hypothetical protein
MPDPPADIEALPFVAGTSPFHLKGVAYQGHTAYADHFIPGGARAVAAAFRDPALRTFFEQQFLAASWYDALPIVPVWHVCARLLEQNDSDFLRIRTRHQAERDIGSVYRFLLKLASAESVAVRVPLIVQRYFAFASTDASVVSPGLVRVLVKGVPSLLVPWLRIVSETYVRVALELAGAKFVQILRLPSGPSGEAHGVPLSTVGLEIQLDPRAPGDAPRA